MNPDKLRTLPSAVEFVKGFFDDGKPVAAICHAAWTLLEAGVVRGRNGDLMAVAYEDDNLVKSRKPDDIPAFNEKMLALFASARHTASA